MIKDITRKGLIFTAFLMAIGVFTQSFAQDRYATERAQQVVREKIIRDKGGDAVFPLNSQAETFSSGNRTEVRGSGIWVSRTGQRQLFTYSARVNTQNGKVDKIKYKIDDSDSNGGGRIPNWAIGTFNGRNPQTGGTITLTINADGSVNIQFDGNRMGSATVRGNRLYNDGSEAILTQIQNGIRTISVTDGQAIDYYRTQTGGGIGNGIGGGNVPSWAIGTFSAQNPQTGGTITLTISGNGNVLVNIDGNVSNATMNGDRLYNNGSEARVIKTRNGFRTVSVTDGQSIEYRRIN